MTRDLVGLIGSGAFASFNDGDPVWNLGGYQPRAVGGGDTDRELVEWAGWGVAMGNGHPELRAVADEVTATNDDDGVAVVLERLLDGA